MELSRPQGPPLPGGVKRCFCQITRVFSCILRHVGSDPQAERGRGEVNLSPIEGLTLRPRVGGFYMSGTSWEARLHIFYVSGSDRRASREAFFARRYLFSRELLTKGSHFGVPKTSGKAFSAQGTGLGAFSDEMVHMFAPHCTPR